MTLSTRTLPSAGCSSSQVESASLTRLSTTARTSEETSLSLVCDENFGSGTLTESTAVRPSRQSSPVSVTFAFFAWPDVFGIAGHLARQRATETGKVRAAIALRNIVGEAENVLVVAVIPPHGDFHRRVIAFAANIDRLVDQFLLRAVEIACT